MSFVRNGKAALIGIVLTLGGGAIAADKFTGAIPVHNIYPHAGGIIYPSLLTAAGVNPAALPQRGMPATVLGVTYSPPPGGSGSHEYSTAFASGDKNMGLGVGYTGSMESTPTHGLYLGGGFRSASTSIGLGLRDNNIGDGFAPETDLGIISSGATEVAFGLVLYHLEESPQIDFGIGFGKDKNYNFEVNVLMPPVSAAFQQDAAYTITAATTVYASIFGLSFSSSYLTYPATVTQSVSLLIWLYRSLGVTVQYQSPNRSYYGIIAKF